MGSTHVSGATSRETSHESRTHLQQYGGEGVGQCAPVREGEIVMSRYRITLTVDPKDAWKTAAALHLNEGSIVNTLGHADGSIAIVDMPDDLDDEFEHVLDADDRVIRYFVQE